MKRISVVIGMLCAAWPAGAAPSQEELQLPSMSYADVVFLHPNGCLYTRTDPPGQGRRWIAVTNGAYIAPGARNGSECTTVLVQPAG